MQLIHLFEVRINDRLSHGRDRTARAYRSTLNSVLSYQSTCSPCNPTLGKVFNPSFLLGYQHFLEGRHLSMDTISFYMRMLRSMYNYAVDRSYLPFTPRLFSCVYTGVSKTMKRAIPVDQIRHLSNLALDCGSPLDESRDLFLFSLYAQGISFVDMAYLQKENLVNDTLTYYRRKTGSKITVSLIPEARAILQKYALRAGGSPYLFPVIRYGSPRPLRLQYESALHAHNLRLKQLGRLIGMQEKLTSYVARHSWATIAYHSGVDISVISQAMGHRTEEVTRIYLASFSLDTLMDANRVVMSELKGGKKYGHKKVRHLMSDRPNTLQT